ncbi:hypothetical protein SteCoe_18995 [Stentor coeruleus]|uniref:Glutaredoxin domain-containing protein n=1 Tax=Stentor coeruleus TaxID=5963 RepID=A0A1R2BVL5_9CILI|nr:hypothetical protein SteCoe_18995 [Stentor coeruleus]
MGICSHNKNQTLNPEVDDTNEKYDLSYDLKQGILVIFANSRCGKSEKACELLRSVNVMAKVIDINSSTSSSALKRALKEASGSSQSPYIFIAGKYYGGLNEVSTGVKDHSIQKLVNSKLESIGAKLT